MSYSDQEMERFHQIFIVVLTCVLTVGESNGKINPFAIRHSIIKIRFVSLNYERFISTHIPAGIRIFFDFALLTRISVAVVVENVLQTEFSLQNWQHSKTFRISFFSNEFGTMVV